MNLNNRQDDVVALRSQWERNYAATRLIPKITVYIHALKIHPDYHGHDLGHMLLSLAIETISLQFNQQLLLNMKDDHRPEYGRFSRNHHSSSQHQRQQQQCRQKSMTVIHIVSQTDHLSQETTTTETTKVIKRNFTSLLILTPTSSFHLVAILKW
jgi:hypothetical protein